MQSKLTSMLVFLGLPMAISAIILIHTLKSPDDSISEEKMKQTVTEVKKEVPHSSIGYHSCSKCGKQFKLKES